MKKIIVLLSLAVVAGVVSVTPLAAHWNMFSLGNPAPEGHALIWVIDVWRAVVDTLAQGQVLSAERASDWRAQGVGVDQFLFGVSVVSVVLAWIAALGGSATMRAQATHAPTPTQWREVAVGVSQAQHGLTNVLLDPQAQPVAEPLADIARQLEQIGEAISTAHDAPTSSRR